MDKSSEIIIVLDKSGSMNCIREATIKGINDFISEVRKTPGEGFWTLVQFDDYPSAVGAKEQFPHVVYERKPDNLVEPLQLNDFVPRGGTALIDAAVLTLQGTRDRLVSMPEQQRPRVMVVVITDGEENSSRQFNNDKLKELSAELQSQFGVQFIYLGANQDSFYESKKYGIVQPMSYPGLQGVGSHLSSGLQHGLASQNSAALPFDYSVGSAVLSGNLGSVHQSIMSGSVGCRAWKADGNESMLRFLSSAEPEGAIKP